MYSLKTMIHRTMKRNQWWKEKKKIVGTKEEDFTRSMENKTLGSYIALKVRKIGCHYYCFCLHFNSVVCTFLEKWKDMGQLSLLLYMNASSTKCPTYFLLFNFELSICKLVKVFE